MRFPSTAEEQTNAGSQWKRFRRKPLVPRVSSLGSHGRRGEAPPDDAEPLRRPIRGGGRARRRFRARIQPPTQLPLRTRPISHSFSLHPVWIPTLTVFPCFRVFVFQDEGEGMGEQEGEGEVEGQGEVEIESEGDGEGEHDRESEGEREQSSQEVEVGEREESEGRDSDSDAKDDGYSQRGVTSKRRDDVVESGSERSEENHYEHHDDEEEEVDEARSPRYNVSRKIVDKRG